MKTRLISMLLALVLLLGAVATPAYAVQLGQILVQWLQDREQRRRRFDLLGPVHGEHKVRTHDD